MLAPRYPPRGGGRCSMKDRPRVIPFRAVALTPAAIAQRKRALRQELKRLERLSRRGGRHANDHSGYVSLLIAWEADVAKRPNVPAQRRMQEFIRRAIPEKCGLKIGAPGGAFWNALARGRWWQEWQCNVDWWVMPKSLLS